MNSKTLFFFVVFGTLFVSCKEEKTIKEFMVDSWQTSYLKIEMATYQNSDSLYVFEDKFNNPTQVAQSKYNSDGTFSAWFLNNNGEKLSNVDGKWSVEKDSLIVNFFYNNREMKVSYFIEKTTDGFVGKSRYDWDYDGKIDDLLTMKTTRIKQ
jgi:hypothetical protein